MDHTADIHRLQEAVGELTADVEELLADRDRVHMENTKLAVEREQPSLRDRFAMAALAVTWPRHIADLRGSMSADEIANEAYAIADAMLREREAKR